MFVANQKQDVMPDVALSFDVPSNLKVGVATEGHAFLCGLYSPQASSGSGKADLTFTGNIAAFGHVRMCVCVCACIYVCVCMHV